MRDPASRFVRFARELYRRRVPRVILGYAVAGWAAATLSNDFREIFELPEWMPRLVLALVLLGFPIAVAVSWALDVTPKGIVRTSAEPDMRPRHVKPGYRGHVATAVMVLLLLVLGFLTVRRWVGGDGGYLPDEPVAVITSPVRGAAPDPIGDGVATLLVTRLESLGWPVVDNRILRGALKLPGDPAQVARRAGAGLFIRLGLEFGSEGESVRVRADLNRVDDPGVVVRTAEVEGPVSGIMTLVDLVAGRLAGAGGSIPRQHPDPVAVMPATFEGPPRYEYLGEGVATLLASRLERAGWPTSDTRSLFGVVKQQGAATNGFASAQAAQMLFASFFVETRIDVGADAAGAGPERSRRARVRMRTDLYHVSDARTPVESFEAEGRIGDVPALARELADRLAKAANIEGRGGRDVVEAPTASLEALEAFITGERQFRAGRYAEAVAAFEKAVATDSGFALGYYRLSIAADWISDIGPYVAWQQLGVSRAVANGARLTWRRRLLVEARRAQQEGDVAGAERLYEWILAAYPDDYEANFQLAEIRFHNAPLDGRSALGAGDYWQQVLFFEPDDFGALAHWARLQALSGRLAELEAVTSRALELEPEGDRALELQAILAFATNDSALVMRTIRSLERAASPRMIWTVASRVGIYARNLSGSERIARLLTSPSRPTEARVLGHVTLAHLLVAQGRWRAARVELLAARTLDPLGALVFDVSLSMAPFLPVSAREELVVMRDRLLDTSPSPPTGAPVTELTVHDSVYDRLRLYALGTVSLALGRESDANRFVAELERLGGSEDAIALGEELGRSLRSQIHLVRGATSAAALSWETFRVETASSKIALSPFFALTRERFLRALNLREVGRNEEALKWFSTFGEVSVYDLAYLAPARFHRGQMLEGLRDLDSAALEYRQVLELWAHADPELLPLVEQARARLRAMGLAAD